MNLIDFKSDFYSFDKWFNLKLFSVKKIIILFVSIFVLQIFQVKAGNYYVDDKALDQLFASAQSITLGEMSANVPGFSASAFNSSGEYKDPLIAILLDFFLGGLGIHRFYLGTETMTGIGYILTCGGILGIVPLIDLIVLIVDYDDISPYIDNPRFFMW